jgi:hypothetical protein
VHIVGLGGLDLADRRAEIRNVERIVVVADDFAAVLAGEIVGPDADIAGRIVVGADIENLLAEILERPFEQRYGLLVAAGVHRDRIGLAQAAFVDRAVDKRHLVAPQHRPARLARCAGDRALQHDHLVFESRPLGILGIFLDVGLSVIDLEVELLAQQAARGVDLVNGKLHAHV